MNSAELNLSRQNWILHLLRAFFALLVVLSHFKGFFFQKLGADSNLIEKITRVPFSLGHFAVIGFFVISGYLVGGPVLTSKKTISTKRYIFNRITRLWTVLLPCLIFSLFAARFSCGFNPKSQFCMGMPSFTLRTDEPPLQSLNFGDFLGNIFFVQNFKVPEYGSNGPLWSLAFEFWYYIAFIAIYNLAKFRDKSNTILYVSVFLIFVTSQVVNFNWYFLGLPWLFGALTRIFVYSRSREILKRVNFLHLIVFVIVPTQLILFLAFFLNEKLSVLLVSVSVCFLISNLSNFKVEILTSMEKRLSKLTFKLSNSSFSLYAFHFPLLAILASFFSRDLNQEFTLSNLLKRIWIIPFVYLICYLLYLLTESRTKSIRIFLLYKFKNLLDE